MKRPRANEQAGVPLVQSGLRERARRKTPSSAVGFVGSTLANISVPSNSPQQDNAEADDAKEKLTKSVFGPGVTSLDPHFV